MASPIIRDCLFKGITFSALEIVDNGGATSAPIFVGNQVLGAGKGCAAPAVVDCSVVNNLFFDTSVVVWKDGVATTDTIRGNVVLASADTLPQLFRGPGFVSSDTYGKTDLGFTWGGHAADPFKNVFIAPDLTAPVAVLFPSVGGGATRVVFSWLDSRDQGRPPEWSQSVSGAWEAVDSLSAWRRGEEARLFFLKDTEGSAWFMRIPRLVD